MSNWKSTMENEVIPAIKSATSHMILQHGPDYYGFISEVEEINQLAYKMLRQVDEEQMYRVTLAVTSAMVMVSDKYTKARMMDLIEIIDPEEEEGRE